ncbi:hypothetical protein TNCV_765141 [Trichonephila clavipes]|nr:hypothetical protein TNCV_765141 [Trichonephila clavipes]
MSEYYIKTNPIKYSVLMKPKLSHGAGGEGNILQPPVPVVSAVNAHKTFGPTDLTSTFSVARHLIDGYSSRKMKGRPSSFQVRKCVVQDDVRLAIVGKYMRKMIYNYRRCNK